ncbi:MAG: hypothetical protein RIE24_09255 [Silicimonas sp.]
MYFATSVYSEETQMVGEADRYPVRLFSWPDIVNILRAGDRVVGEPLSLAAQSCRSAEASDAAAQPVKGDVRRGCAVQQPLDVS